MVHPVLLLPYHAQVALEDNCAQVDKWGWVWDRPAALALCLKLQVSDVTHTSRTCIHITYVCIYDIYIKNIYTYKCVYVHIHTVYIFIYIHMYIQVFDVKCLHLFVFIYLSTCVYTYMYM